MNEQDILRAIRMIIVEAKSDTMVLIPEDILPDWQIEQLPLAMDSIDFVRMIIGIEETFGIMVQDNDFIVSSMQTVSDVVEMVKSRFNDSMENI